jgi:hypothetical protein
MLRQIQDNLHMAMKTLWSSLAKLGYRGETLEDLERNGEALVESSASFVQQVTPWHTRLVRGLDTVFCFCCDRQRVRSKFKL